MNAFKALMVVSLVASQAALATQQIESSLKGEDSSEPQVQSFYNEQCGRMADQQGLQNDSRATFLQGCLQEASNIWPVGMEKDEG